MSRLGREADDRQQEPRGQAGLPVAVHSSEGLGVVVVQFIVFNRIRAQILDNGVHLNGEPLAKQAQSSLLGPCTLIGVPAVQFSFEDLGEDLLQDLPLFRLGLELWDQVDRLFAFHVREKA